MTIQMPTQDLDHRGLRNVYGTFPTGVTALCTIVDGEPVGMAASTFTGVSLEPPLVSVCLQNSSTTWPKLRNSRLGVSILASGQEAECATLSRKNGDRFDGVGWDRTESSAVFISGAVAWLECDIVQELAAGDHLIVLLSVLSVHTQNTGEPLVFHRSRYRRISDSVDT